MYDATDNIPTADEAIAAVRELVDRYEILRQERDALEEERDGLRSLLAEETKDDLVIREIDLPSGRDWGFVEDAMVLAISPDLDEATKARLLAQIKPPKLTTCDACGAPVYEGAACRMH